MRRFGLTALALLLVLAGAVLGLALPTTRPFLPDGHGAPASPTGSAASPATTNTRSRPSADAVARTEAAGAGEQAFLRTSLDGMPVPSLVHDLGAGVSGLPDWSGATSRHSVPDTGNAFAVLARGCLVAKLHRTDLPSRGELHVRMTRSPVLDVRLVNVPPMLREHLSLQLQVAYEQLTGEENDASVLIGDRSPIVMHEDRALIPLSLRKPGHVVLHAQSRHSNISYPTPKVPFEPVSQTIELDLAVLAPACSLATLTLTLRFPYTHPADDFHVSLCDADGSTVTSKEFARDGKPEISFVVRDLPRARIWPVLSPDVAIGKGAMPRIHLEPVDMTGGDCAVPRDVVAEGTLDVLLSGRDGLAADGVSVLLRDEQGRIVAAPWPLGSGLRIEHLPAMVCHVQAVAYAGSRCSPIVRRNLGTAEAIQIALQLSPAAEVEVVPGAFGASTRHLDAHHGDHGASRVFLDPRRPTRVWMPLGTARVEWAGGSTSLPVVAGVVNSWRP